MNKKIEQEDEPVKQPNLPAVEKKMLHNQHQTQTIVAVHDNIVQTVVSDKGKFLTIEKFPKQSSNIINFSKSSS